MALNSTYRDFYGRQICVCEALDEDHTDVTIDDGSCTGTETLSVCPASIELALAYADALPFYDDVTLAESKIIELASADIRSFQPL